MSEKIIHLISRNALQNELFISYLEKETGLPITNSTTLNQAPIDEYGSDVKHLVLFDTMGIDVNDIWVKIGIGTNLNPVRMLIALFNVDKKNKLEKEAINRGIRGVFYENEPLIVFAKGVQSMFEGEMWYPRKTISQCLLESRATFKSSADTAALPDPSGKRDPH